MGFVNGVILVRRKGCKPIIYISSLRSFTNVSYECLFQIKHKPTSLHLQLDQARNDIYHH
jgi:hypothetical protein